MMAIEYLQERLQRVVDATETAQASSGWWIGDSAGELRVADNLKTGRVHFVSARRCALNGLAAICRGDNEYAEIALRNAEALVAGAYEKQLEPKDFRNLNGDAGLRGRPNTTEERNFRLLEAYKEQEKKGLKGKSARQAAIRSCPELTANFENLSDAGIRAALNKAKELAVQRKL